jgi:hypothetical protein
MLQLATSDGENRQQVIALTDGTVFRRSVTTESRTRWRYGAVSDLPAWLSGYCSLAGAAPTPMSISHGPILMEMTDEEVGLATKGTLARNAQLRLQRVLDAMDEGTK